MRTLAILGVGCARCDALAENAEKAAQEMGLDYRLVRVSDVEKILEYDVLMTPALAIDGEVRIVGIVPSVEEIKRLLG